MNQTILTPNTNGATEIRSALQNAGLDWTVEKRKIYSAEGWELPGKFATVRADREGPRSFLGVVGNRYEIIQNADCFGVLDDVIEASGGVATYYKAGETSGGRQVYAACDVGGFEVVPGDEYSSLLMAVSSHDGSQGTKLFLTALRSACKNANRRQILDAQGKGTITSIRHTSSSVERLSMARQALLSIGYTTENLKQMLRELSTRALNSGDVRRISERLFPASLKIDLAADELPEVLVAKREKFVELFESNDNGAVRQIAGTAYNALNAFTEYVDHHSPVRVKRGRPEFEVRQERAIFGTGADAKDQALGIILEETKFVPRRALSL